MLKSEIKVGESYKAKVSGRLVTVKVQEIFKQEGTRYYKGGTRFTCKNLMTGRIVTFKSAAKFRGPASSKVNSKDSKEAPPLGPVYEHMVTAINADLKKTGDVASVTMRKMMSLLVALEDMQEMELFTPETAKHLEQLISLTKGAIQKWNYNL